MIVKQIRLSNKAKDRLSRLKAKTGIKNWNVLCRWALCYSLKEKTMPTDDDDIGNDHTFSFTWNTKYPEKMRRVSAKSGTKEKVRKQKKKIE